LLKKSPKFSQTLIELIVQKEQLSISSSKQQQQQRQEEDEEEEEEKEIVNKI
jgi:hypothetical protein